VFIEVGVFAIEDNCIFILHFLPLMNANMAVVHTSEVAATLAASRITQ
jgi:hypothetical protein